MNYILKINTCIKNQVIFNSQLFLCYLSEQSTNIFIYLVAVLGSDSKQVTNEGRGFLPSFARVLSISPIKRKAFIWGNQLRFKSIHFRGRITFLKNLTIQNCLGPIDIFNQKVSSHSFLPLASISQTLMEIYV